jgi:hypothetical protein
METSMTRYLLSGAAALLFVAVPALSQPYRPPSNERPCLRQGYIYDYQLVPGDRSLVVTDLGRRRFRLNFMAKCYDLKFQFGLRFKTFGVGSLSCVDRGDSVLTDRPGNNQCIIRSVEHQTPELDRADFEAARDLKGDRDRRYERRMYDRR